MEINGAIYRPGSKPFRIEAGESATIKVEVPSAYLRT